LLQGHSSRKNDLGRTPGIYSTLPTLARGNGGALDAAARHSDYLCALETGFGFGIRGFFFHFFRGGGKTLRITLQVVEEKKLPVLDGKTLVTCPVFLSGFADQGVSIGYQC